EMIEEGIREGSLLQRYPMIVTTQDWHVDPGGHWSEHPDFLTSWPVHCRAGSPGAELHPLIAAALRGVHPERLVQITKGEHEAAYSGFDGHDGNGTPLAELL